jgi:hypothetical protein
VFEVEFALEFVELDRVLLEFEDVLVPLLLVGRVILFVEAYF